jgi:histidinol dehydrogenase
MRILSGREALAAVTRLAARSTEFRPFERRVRGIVDAVRKEGDQAVRRYARRWDEVLPSQPLRVSQKEMDAAFRSIPRKMRDSLRRAAGNIRRFCQWQVPSTWSRSRDGISLGQIIRPLDSVGCYVPGGRYPLVSTVLMTVIPAQVAGVKSIRVVSPQPSLEVLGAAAMLGIREFYRVGGAQAIAALAYGTKTIARVDKIVGPGNAYVTAAKKQVSFDCAIDFLAGPTEALILSDFGNADFIASDLIAQAEHDTDALPLFLTTSAQLARAVDQCVSRRAEGNQTAQRSLREHGHILIARSHRQALDWANRIAPEHITVSEHDVCFIQNAGSVFVGDYSAQAAGDYASGPNHVLPTAGQARFRGGLSVLDFVKVITVQRVSEAGLKKIARVIEGLAQAEGLEAHARSIRVRCAHA